jgi:DNA gyrase/topoisomerase IV subunit B
VNVDKYEQIEPSRPFAERVRARPRMYVEDADHLLLAIVENALDEAVHGYGKRIVVTLAGTMATVVDGGRGVPVERPTFSGTPAQRERAQRTYGDASGLEIVFTAEPGQGGDRIARGLGPSIIDGKRWSPRASTVCALCAELIVETTRAGVRYRARFERGHCVERPIALGSTTTIGTSITMRPDFELFGATAFDPERIAAVLRAAAERHESIELQLHANGG